MLVDLLALILLGVPFLALVVISWFWPAEPDPSAESADWGDVVTCVIDELL
jgi:hypothetical protein